MSSDNFFKGLRNPWFFALYSGLVLFSFFVLDKPIAHYFGAVPMAIKYPYLVIITNLDKIAKIFLAFFLVALFFRYIVHDKIRERKSWFLWFSVFIPTLLCLGLKMLCGRARPILLLQDQIFGFYAFKIDPSYWSFPSGHITTTMGLLFGLMVLFPRYLFLLLGFGLFFSATRVLLGYHF